MKTFAFTLLALPALLVCLAPDGSAQGRQSQLNQLAETGGLYGGELAANDRNDAGERMVELASELQALYDPGGNPEPGNAVREEIATRSEALGQAVSDLIGYINQTSRPPEESEPIVVPEENYDARTLRLVTTYLDVTDSLTQFVNGDTMDGEELDRVRAGLEIMGAVTAVLPETRF